MTTKEETKLNTTKDSHEDPPEYDVDPYYSDGVVCAKLSENMCNDWYPKGKEPEGWRRIKEVEPPQHKYPLYVKGTYIGKGRIRGIRLESNLQIHKVKDGVVMEEDQTYIFECSSVIIVNYHPFITIDSASPTKSDTKDSAIDAVDLIKMYC